MSDVDILETIEKTVAPPGLKSAVRWLLVACASAGLILLMLASCSHFRFGSVGAGLDYLTGKRLLVDAKERAFGEVYDGRDETVAFNFTNMTGNPVRIVGAKSDCTCVAVESLPLTIADGHNEALKVRIGKGKKTGAVTESVLLYTDCPEMTELMVRVTGRVRE